MDSKTSQQDETPETTTLLRSILRSLENIEARLTLQEALQHRHSQEASATERPVTATTFSEIAEDETRRHAGQASLCRSKKHLVLQEALKRYESDSVARWSTVYGAYEEETPIQDRDTSAQLQVWPSLVGECWRIPHDNRVSLCFMSPGHDVATPVRVRNFLFHFHKSRLPEISPWKYFNVWDWFDMGLSVNWCPGKGKLDMKQDGLKRIAARRHALAQEDASQPRNLFCLSPLIAPWRRIIHFQALTTLYDCQNAIPERLTDHDLCPFLLANTNDTIFQEPITSLLWRGVGHHLRGSRLVEDYQTELETKGSFFFHVTFYEILPPESEQCVKELWPVGELHSDDTDGGKRRRLRESAFTVIAIPSLGGDTTKARSSFWTMLCMRPDKFDQPYYFEKRDDAAQGVTREMIEAMADVVNQALVGIVKRWCEIAEYFDNLLSEKHALLSPDFHDSLLTDDISFSRSKKYFWAIEFLKEMDLSISQNIEQARLLANHLRANPPAVRPNRSKHVSGIQKMEASVRHLEGIRSRFAEKKDEAVTLRDGLFNASAVMESRASRKQGENIRLLTIVSIFFLPLSFCTSFWSIDDQIFSMTALAVVMPMMAIGTYAIVLNLETVASFAQLVMEKALRVSEIGGAEESTHSPSRLSQLLDYGVDRLGRRRRPESPSRLEPGQPDLGAVHVHVEFGEDSGSSIPKWSS